MFCCLLEDKSLRSIRVFWGDKGLLCDQLIRQVGKVSVVSVQTPVPGWGWRDSKHCMVVAVSCKPGMKLSFWCVR